MKELFYLAAAAMIFFFYFLPALISEWRHTGHGLAITMINLFLGWTLLGWIAALIWACVEKSEEPAELDESAGS